MANWQTSPCWIWPRGKNGKGYGAVIIQGQQRYVHRYIFECFFGKIVTGLTLDHLCRTPSCVNPYHLEAVTSVENVMRGVSPHALNARKSQCPKGHPYDMPRKSGRRGCRTCQQAHSRNYKRIVRSDVKRRMKENARKRELRRLRGLDAALADQGERNG